MVRFRVALVLAALSFARIALAQSGAGGKSAPAPADGEGDQMVNAPAENFEAVVDAGPQWNALEPVGAVPESVKIIERDAIERSGAATLQDLLHQIAGVPQADEQGAFGQLDISMRGLVASPVTGLSQGVSVFI